MNILHTETLKGWGGQQNKVFREMKSLKKLGHNVFLFCNPNSEIASKAKSENITVFECEMNKKNFISTISKLTKIIDEKSIEFVITHSSTDGWVGAIASKLSKIKPYIARERHNSYPINGFLSKLMHKYLCNLIIAVSDNVKEHVLKSIRISDEKIFILNNYVELEKFKQTTSTLRDELDIPKESIVLGIFTSLRKDKGVFDFFEVAKTLLKKYDNLYIVFGGKYRQKDKDEIDEYFLKNNYNLEKIKWTGYRTDANNVMKGFDIFLFPSYSEGLPNVVLEAMASNLVSVVYDIKPMNILVKDNFTGFCAKYLDTNELTTKVEILLNNSKLIKEYGNNSLKYVEDNFSYDKFENNMKKLVEMAKNEKIN